MSDKGRNLDGCKILLGVSGGVAAYKSVDLASKLTGAGAVVKTVMTESACQFICAKSFEAVTCQAVYSSLWSSSEDHTIGHVSLGQWADVVVVAPATANIIGKVACGICDDLLSTLLCRCWENAVLLAPAMNDKMWSNPAVVRNVETVKKMGFEMIGPETGRLACGTYGAGRMSEPEKIMEAVAKAALGKT